MKITCIIPAWNEEQQLATVINDVKQYVDEVVVVDDGSTDQTAQVALANHVILLRHIINRGQGAALQTGNEYALNHGADIIVHFDADGQFLASEIKEMVEPIKEHQVDAVLGSRFLGKETNMPPVKRYLLIPMAKLVNYLFFGIKLTDPQSGFRALSRRSLAVIKIEQADWAHCTEILSKIFANKLSYKEIPITVVYNKFGRNFNSGVKIIKDLFLAKFIN
jgi:polyprenyl-phospho-N-acetylgalactosaminyl synthase